jgi:hypothetical protein
VAEEQVFLNGSYLFDWRNKVDPELDRSLWTAQSGLFRPQQLEAPAKIKCRHAEGQEQVLLDEVQVHF